MLYVAEYRDAFDKISKEKGSCIVRKRAAKLMIVVLTCICWSLLGPIDTLASGIVASVQDGNVQEIVTDEKNSELTYEQLYKSPGVYKNLYARLQKLNKENPEVSGLYTIGKTADGRELLVFRLGTGSKRIFINAEHHAREYITSILVLNQIEYLLKAYTENAIVDGYNIREILKNTSFWFMPMVNPDGLELCTQGRKGINNSDIKKLIPEKSNYFDLKTNGMGVDLNRNYGAEWGKSKDRAGQRYANSFPGNYSFSEAETVAVKALCNVLEFDLSISYHAAGGVIFWYFNQATAEEKRDLAIAQKLSSVTGYGLVGKSASLSDPTRGGGFKDWFVQSFKKPAFTIEVGDGTCEQPLDFSQYADIWKQNRVLPLIAAQQVGATERKNVKGILYNGFLAEASMKYDGQLLRLDAEAVFKKLGFQVTASGNGITAKLAQNSVALMRDSRIVTVNGINQVLVNTVSWENGKFYMPSEVLQRLLGYTVVPDTTLGLVKINGELKYTGQDELSGLFPETYIYGTIIKDTDTYTAINGSKKGVLKSGTKVEVIRDREEKWHYIKTADGEQVWVPSNVLSIAPDGAVRKDIPTGYELEYAVKARAYSSKTDYLMWLDLSRQRLYIFQKQNGEYKAIRNILCSTGKSVTPTIKGDFEITGKKGKWMQVGNGIGVENYVNFYESYYFHSILLKNNRTVYDGTLGTQASHGCVRLPLQDIAWIYNTIPTGTKVVIR